MACYHPLRAYRLTGVVGENGKAVIVFKVPKDAPYEEMDFACGRCVGCRLDRSRDWAVRCVHEASLYSANCFITLTYRDDQVPHGGTLVKKDFQDFIKRLRARFDGVDLVEKESGELHRPIRYFHCGEYGSKLGRPHYHACIFNFDFEDKKLWSTRNGVRLYRSAILEDLWSVGFSTIGDVTFESAAYCARYIFKKVMGKKAGEHYVTAVDETTGEAEYRLPEYTTMSRRPGIGAGWFRKYRGELYPKDFVTIGGKKFSLPKFYDGLQEKVDKECLERVKKARKERHSDDPDATLARLRVAEKVKCSSLGMLKRSFEDGD